jgi:hypothetical protein
MRVRDKPLPGDLIIRRREEPHPVLQRSVTVWIVTHWPDADTIVAGPYQSFNYALDQARRVRRDRSEFIWQDHAKPGTPEQLTHVNGDSTG